MSLPTAPPGTASGYVRLSRAADTANLSLDGMIADVERTAARHGLTLIGPVHVDNGRSGAIRNRPALTAWLSDATELRAGTLIAYSVDRMSREGSNFAGPLLDVLEGLDSVTGARVRNTVRLLDTQGLDSDNAAFRLSFLIRAEQARDELHAMRRRAQDRDARAKAQGRWTHGPAPFGWQLEPGPHGGNVLAPNEHEAELLRTAADAIIGGTTITEAARELSRTASTRAGGPWRTHVLGRVLASDRTRQLLGTTRSNAVRSRVTEAKRGPRGERARKRLLSGILLCSGCSEPLNVGSRIARDGKPVALYRCGSYSRGWECPQPVTITAEIAESAVTEEFLAWHGHRQRVFTEVVPDATLEAAQEALEAAQRALLASPDIEHLEAVQAAVRAAQEAQETSVPGILRTRSGPPLATLWEADPDGRRELLRPHVRAAFVYPASESDRVRVDWVLEPDD